MMDAWYFILDQILPFGWTQYTFMKNALLGILLIAPVFGILSTMIVNNSMAFFSDSIGHSALTGVAIGVVMGIKSPLWSMVLFAVAFAVFLVIVKHANTISTDTIIGVFSSTAIALGLVILSKQGFNKFTNYLIGDLLGIRASDILLLFFVFAGVIIFWIFMFNKLLVVSVNQSLAGSRGLNVRLIEIAFTIVIAVIVTVCIQWVGLLIINSLLVLPAAAARNVARNVKQYHIISILIAVFSGISGLIISFYWGTAAGATIVLISAVLFAITFLLKGRF